MLKEPSSVLKTAAANYSYGTVPRGKHVQSIEKVILLYPACELASEADMGLGYRQRILVAKEIHNKRLVTAAARRLRQRATGNRRDEDGSPLNH